MESLKCNSEGRLKFLELTEQGGKVISEDGIFFIEKEDVRVASLSKKFSDVLVEKGILEQI